MASLDFQHRFDSSARGVIFVIVCLIATLNYFSVRYHERQLKRELYHLTDIILMSEMQGPLCAHDEAAKHAEMMESKLQKFMEFNAIVRVLSVDPSEAFRQKEAFARDGYNDEWARENGDRDVRFANCGAGGPTFKVYYDWRQIYSSANSVHYTFTLLSWLIFLLPLIVFYIYWVRRRFVKPLLTEIHVLQPAVSFFQGVQMLAHDIRKPFALVKAFVRMLERETNPLEQKAIVERYRGDLWRATEGVDHMVRDILEYGSSSVQATGDSSLDVMLFHAIKTACTNHANKLVNFRFHLQHPFDVIVDAQKYERVFINIINNAMQAVEENGFLWVETTLFTSKKARWIKICIGNSGSYITPDDCQKVFAPFYSKGKRGGTGLGLAIVKKIVQEHGGDIWVQSEEGVGTEFFCTVPASIKLRVPGVEWPQTNKEVSLPNSEPEESPEIAEKPKPAIVAETAPLVVIIEDDMLMADAWVHSLAPHPVRCFLTPRDMKLAFESIDRSRLIAIVSDMYFGELDDQTGHDLAFFIKERIDTPILISSNTYGLVQEPCSAVDLYIGKEALTYEELLQILKSSKV